VTQATLNVLCGLIANGLTGLLGSALGRAPGRSKREQEHLQLIRKDATLGTILQKATASVARSSRPGDQRRAEKLRFFLSSPDVEAMVRQIYASQLTPSRSGSYMESIRAEFLASLSLHLGQSEGDATDLGSGLLEALVAGCTRALAASIEKGLLPAHEAMAEFRHHMVLDELAAIQKNFELLTGPTKPNLQLFLQFEKKYRQQVGSRHRHIMPPHFDAARKVPIDQIYVPPNFVTAPKKKRGEEPTVLKASDFLARVYRAILLGNPGGGKSTFTHKLCHDLATRYSDRMFAGRQITPIPVVVREYGARKKSHNCSILQFIEETSNSTYQVQPPAGAFDYLLLNGRAVVIFDGLDELLETSYRQEISGDIEAFCNLYPPLPVLVTSREVGYEQAPLDEERFETFRLAPFEENQVNDYARKWFAVDKDLSPEQQKQKSEGFLRESQIVPDLRSNPLMLALMCNIYRGENYIPRNRPEVYEKCATMLFERWDKSRGILVPLPFEAHIRPAMQYLAQWIYADEGLQGGVTERELIAKASDYLAEWRFEDTSEAEGAAREFIEFCRNRAWVFTDTGTTKEGERLYQFTHRTFLEYFTAAHLVRTNPTPDRLGGLLRPRIAKREWDIVAQLAFQIQHKNIEGAGDELLAGVINEARNGEGDTGWNLLSFASRCLEFMVPKPKVTREITEACVESCIRWGLIATDDERESLTDEPASVLGGLVWAASENRPTIGSTIQGLLVDRVNNADEKEAVLAFDMGSNLALFLHMRQGQPVPESEVSSFWYGVSNTIFDACSSRAVALSSRHFQVFHELFFRRKASVSDLIKWYGTEAVFRPSSHPMIGHFWFSAPGAWLLHSALLATVPSAAKENLDFNLTQLSELGRILLSSSPPWLKRTEHEPPQLARWIFEVEASETKKLKYAHPLKSETAFGAFVILAPLLEASDDRFLRDSLQTLNETQIPFVVGLRPLLLARFGPVEPPTIQQAMERAGFDTKQQTLISRWIRKEINLAGVKALHPGGADVAK